MKKITQAKMRYGTIAMLIALVLLQVPANAQKSNDVDRNLEGVWEVTTMPRDCATGDPIPPAFLGLYTFHQDGTISSWYSSGTPATGNGLWRRELGWSDYSFKLARFLRSPTGGFSGKIEIGGRVTLSESGDEYASDEYVITYTLAGIPGPPTCLSSVATRFKLND